MHSGEIQIAERLQLPYNPVEPHYNPAMPLQHQVFFSNLPYFIFGNLDAQDRPWVSIITGEPGFVAAKTPNQLHVDVNICKWDPIVTNIRSEETAKASKPFPLFSGLGVDFSNRRRNKVAGIIQADTIAAEDIGNEKVHLKLQITTQESLGNCPKYINIRTIKYTPRPNPELVHNVFEIPSNFDGLPKECQDAVTQVDTMFIATRHFSNPKDFLPNISDMDVNIRGGPKGFVRVLPGAKQIAWPDFSGNRLYQSLGNIESDKKLAMVFPNFVTGDMLYVTGDAVNLVGDAATDLMPSCQLVTVLTITGYVFVKHGLDLEQKTPEIAFSPYNPPVRYLKSEAALHPLARETVAIPISLSEITPITKNVAAFTFTLPPDRPVNIIPGQHVLIDLSKAKPKQYTHMNETRPQRLNDDFVRSWTISSVPPVAASGSYFDSTNTFTCTIKLKEEGEITPFIHSYAAIPAKDRPKLTLSQRGVNGSFSVFAPAPSPTSPLTLVNKNMLFIGAGIGITPLLAFHSAIQALHLDANIHFLFSGRDDELKLVAPFFSSATPHTPLVASVKLFHTGNTQDYTAPVSNVLKRRMEKKDLEVEGFKDMTAFMCGPVGFMEHVVDWLGELGMAPDRIKQETFNF